MNKTGRSAETARNLKIVREYEEGTTFKQLAKKYDMSVGYMMKIVAASKNPAPVKKSECFLYADRDKKLIGAYIQAFFS